MDLNSINANINRLLTNIWAVISFFKEFAVDGAKDVSITYINADGSESVKTFPNISKMWVTFNITNDNGIVKDLDGNIVGGRLLQISQHEYNLRNLMQGNNYPIAVDMITPFIFTKKSSNSKLKIDLTYSLEHKGDHFRPAVYIQVDNVNKAVVSQYEQLPNGIMGAGSSSKMTFATSVLVSNTNANPSISIRLGACSAGEVNIETDLTRIIISEIGV